MAGIPYEEVLRNGRCFRFVRSPLWSPFEGGLWRRYRKVRLVQQRAKDRRYRAGYADGTDWYWTSFFEDEDDARRALFPMIEHYADARDAKEAAERPPVETGTMDGENWRDWVEKYTPEELADFREDFSMSDDERAEVIEMFRREKEEAAEMVRDGWILRLPEDFPALPEDELDYDGY